MVDHFKKYQLKTFIPESGKLTADEQELADYVKLLDTELNERDKQYSYQYLQSILKSTSHQPVKDLSINKQDNLSFSSLEILNFNK